MQPPRASSRAEPGWLGPASVLTVSALRQAKGFHGAEPPHAVALLAALPKACMVVGDTFAVPH